MKSIKLIMLSLAFICLGGCKDSNKSDISSQKHTQKQILKTLEESTIKNISFTETPKNAIFNNIEFTYNGATFNAEQKSFLEVDMKKLPLEEGLSINVIFNLKGEDGKKPQALFTFVDEKSNPNKELTFYFAGRRITGILNQYRLFGNDYSAKKGMSKAYFDTPKLQLNKYYSLSIILEKTRIQFYVNGEMYTEFDNFVVDDFKGEKLLFGAYKKNLSADLSRFFSGTIRNFELYDRAMTSDEALDYFLLNQSEINDYNDSVDLKKMQSTEN